MDDSRYNAYGTHCLNDLMLQLPSPMGDEERNDTLYLLRRSEADGEVKYVTDRGSWRGDRYELMVAFIDRVDAQRAVNDEYPGHELEEIQGADLTQKVLGKMGIKFRYIGGGKQDSVNIPISYFEKYEEYRQQGRPKVSTSEFLASLPDAKDFLSPKKMKTIRDTFEGLNIPNAVVTVRTLKMNDLVELVVDFNREGGFLREEISKIEAANRRLQVRFGHPVPFYINAEIDHTEPAPEKTPNRPERTPEEIARIREARQAKKQKRGNGAPTTPDDGFVCAELSRKIRTKKKTMEHPLVQKLAEAFESREYTPFDVSVLDDESLDVFMHLDLEGEYIVTKEGIDIYLDEPMWRRSYDEKIHNPDHAPKTIRELLEFTEEHQTDVRLFFPDRDGLDFITIPFAQLHAYHDFMPRHVSTDIDELRALPKLNTPDAEALRQQAQDHVQGVPGTNTHAYVAQDDGRIVLVVEVEEVKPLTDVTDAQLFGRSTSLEQLVPEGVTYRFKVVPPIKRDLDVQDSQVAQR